MFIYGTELHSATGKKKSRSLDPQWTGTLRSPRVTCLVSLGNLPRQSRAVVNERREEPVGAKFMTMASRI
ncbi:hypothetical protein LshimejAT787_0103190 [Lyophyllum shimeji]|uniref:Uncharacterized protein n=1 Tax=Lyophyllum shimeji TaxID=47721 RepID=A0A9P3PCJ6_LYOSH|nr:hypothetical protein LshimejAT787_0103190 [Lyophyllum shimeji]